MPPSPPGGHRRPRVATSPVAAAAALAARLVLQVHWVHASALSYDPKYDPVASGRDDAK